MGDGGSTAQAEATRNPAATAGRLKQPVGKSQAPGAGGVHGLTATTATAQSPAVGVKGAEN